MVAIAADVKGAPADERQISRRLPGCAPAVCYLDGQLKATTRAG
jgi:hypothetical protein